MAGTEYSHVHISEGLENVTVLRSLKQGYIILIINNTDNQTSEEVALTPSDARTLYEWLKEAAQ